MNLFSGEMIYASRQSHHNKEGGGRRKRRKEGTEYSLLKPCHLKEAIILDYEG